MLVKITNSCQWVDKCVDSDMIIGVWLTHDELIEKKNIFADWGGEEDRYYGGAAKVIHHFFNIDE